jgi:hypothetical protein
MSVGQEITFSRTFNVYRTRRGQRNSEFEAMRASRNECD